MKFGIRTPSPKRSFKARTTGRVKRAVKRAVDPTYGKKGMGWVKNPKKAAYNKIYNKTSVGARQLITGKEGHRSDPYSARKTKPSLTDRLRSPKVSRTALALCVFLGYLGAHRFYLRQPGMGILYLFTGGLFFIGWIADSVRLIRFVVANKG